MRRNPARQPVERGPHLPRWLENSPDLPEFRTDYIPVTAKVIMKRSRDLVALAAIINADDARLLEIESAAARVREWEQVISRAEREGIAPMLYHHLRQIGYDHDPASMNALRALAVRHRHATEIRLSEFHRMSTALRDAEIDSAALKGVALAGLIYPEPGLRPMRDIDFLVRRSRAGAARKVLENLDYRFDEAHPSRYMRLHHHLPNACRTVDGLNVSVEIHTRANSGDTPGAGTFDALIDPLQDVQTRFGIYRTLGHVDMLNQLCRHALEPGDFIRLVSIMDIQGYIELFDAELDWKLVDCRYPYIRHFLRLTDLVSPLPSALSRFTYDGPSIEDPGKLIPTMGAAFARNKGRLQALRTLASPPWWWFRSYYGIPDDDHGVRRARLKHLARIGVWLARRAVSAAFPTDRRTKS